MYHNNNAFVDLYVYNIVFLFLLIEHTDEV